MSSSESVLTPLSGYVGFDTLTKQIESRLLRRGFQFNVMVVGQSGLGKSSLINTLFAANLMQSKGRMDPSDEVRQTTSITTTSHWYGDLINNEHCWEPIVKYIKDQYSIYLRKELTAVRDRHIADSRVHAVLFMIDPSGHSLRSTDIQVLKKLGDIANVIPVIAKSDALTLGEREVFKKRIRAALHSNGIRTYPFDHDNNDEEDRELNNLVQSILPFAVVTAERTIELDGRPVRARRVGSGLINVENKSHCEFLQLRDFMLRTNLHDLIETTSETFYESFRSKQLLALKESSAKQQAQQTQSQSAYPNANANKPSVQAA